VRPPRDPGSHNRPKPETDAGRNGRAGTSTGQPTVGEGTPNIRRQNRHRHPGPHAAGFVLPTDAELEALAAGLPVDWAATVRRAGGSRASVVAAPAAGRAPAGGSNWLLPVDELAAYLGIAKKAAYDCWQQRRASGLPGRPEPAVPRATRGAMALQPGLSTPVGRRGRTHGGRWGRQRRPDRRRAERWLSATSWLDEAAIGRVSWTAGFAQVSAQIPRIHLQRSAYKTAQRG
jgi:hypothetical protein